MRGDVLALVAVGALAAVGATRHGARAVLVSSEMKGLQEVLGILRAMEQSYHTTHWLASGPNAYGDHLLFERLYAAGGDPDIVKQIDGLGERLVAYVGPMAVEGEALSDCTEHATKRFNLLVKRSGGSSSPDARVHAALEMEKELQEVLSSTYASLKASGVLSLGLDDFLMALADERDTAIYLLQQRLRPEISPGSRTLAAGSASRLRRSDMQVGDFVQSHYRGRWYGQVVSIEKRKDCAPLVEVKILTTQDGRKARKQPNHFLDASHLTVVDKVYSRPEAGSANQGSRCACSSKGGSRGSLNCACGGVR